MTDKNEGRIRPLHGGFRPEVTVEEVERAKVARMQAAKSVRTTVPNQSAQAGTNPTQQDKR
jgi:hypothetical protein